MENLTEYQTRTYWDKTWARFLKYHGMIAPSAKLVQHLFTHVPRNGFILDLGCGEGRNSLYLSQVGYNIIGLDLSFKAASVMKNNFFEESLKGFILTGDARWLPFKGNSLDGVLAHHLFDHLDKNGFDRALSECMRILKPGGVLLLTMDSFAEAASDHSIISKDDGSLFFSKGPSKGLLVRPYDNCELSSLSDLGWQILKDELTPSRSKIMLLRKNAEKPIV
ncbi:MAG: methyltransferase domain-containing protein [Candidatus Riflebacteria bacterium]